MITCMRACASASISMMQYVYQKLCDKRVSQTATYGWVGNIELGPLSTTSTSSLLLLLSFHELRPNMNTSGLPVPRMMVASCIPVVDIFMR